MMDSTHRHLHRLLEIVPKPDAIMITGHFSSKFRGKLVLRNLFKIQTTTATFSHTNTYEIWNVLETNAIHDRNILIDDQWKNLQYNKIYGRNTHFEPRLRHLR